MPWSSGRRPATGRPAAASGTYRSCSATNRGSRAAEVLQLHCRLLRLPRPSWAAAVEEAAARVGLASRAADKVGGFSKGMQQRLGLGVALLGEPRLVFLDEPTSALDPVGRHDVRLLIRQLRAAGVTVFLNTHLLQEAEQVCDRVAVMDRGAVIATGGLPDLLGGQPRVRLRVRHGLGPWAGLLDAYGPWQAEGGWTVVHGVGPARAPDLVDAIVATGARVEVVIFREAIRRRPLAALGVIPAVMVGTSAWGFDRLAHAHSLTSGETRAALPQSLVLFMFSFVVALSASVMASPALAAEVESGGLLTVVARPVRRAEVVLGKWLGLAAVLTGYAVAVVAAEEAAVDAVSGYLPPDPALTAAYLVGKGLLLLILLWR